METLVGAGGWAYFDVPGEDSLEAYARAFNFVEVNSTFYELPLRPRVQAWRNRVPEDFQFAVRAHRSIGDRGFAPTKANTATLERGLAIAEDLGSEFLHLLWPARISPNAQNVAHLRELVEAVDLGSRIIALEVRADRGTPNPALTTMMEDLGIVHAVDLSHQMPAADSSYLYARLFGLGEGNRYQFTNEELEAIAGRVEDTGARKALFTFHGVRMYKDAGRFASFKKTGRFPRVTRGVDREALEEVLLEDAHFPATRGELMRSQGWKVLETSSGTQIRAEDLLQPLPGGTFRSVVEILSALGPKV